ncbi:MAG: sensor domain-containing diguanylate cyclase [Kamptonema sp. SIO4C4]|nr:sensor domain-containing diguanylate cyclase [Kamptonema sp. SIO4C4]
MQSKLFELIKIKKNTVIFPLLQGAIDAADFGVFILDNEKKTCIYNPKFLELWNLSKNSLEKNFTPWLLRKLSHNLKHPLQLITFIQKTLKQSDTTLKELLYFKNGQVIEMQATPIYFREQNIGNSWSFQDITQWIKAEEELRYKTEREQLTRGILKRIRQSLDLSQILQTTVTEVQNLLQTDWVLLYEFNPDWSGQIAVEAVSEGWKEILGMPIYDPCFTAFYIQQYRQGRIHAVTDIYQGDLAPCYVEFLSQLQIRANLAIPILQGDRLWGLLLAHHCQDAREWQPSEIQLLKDLADQVAIAIQQAELVQKLQQANQQLQHLAAIDDLTQLANRRSFDEYLHREWLRLQRHHKPLSLILADVDYFKRYNDTYGHPAGDDCLQEVAKILQQMARRSADLVARYGGEEFALILPNTNSHGAMQVAHQIQFHLQQRKLKHPDSDVSDCVTLSLGVGSMIPTSQFSPEDLITLADQALYHAKKEGRDRIALESSLPYPNA